jgi:hypothetical protein
MKKIIVIFFLSLFVISCDDSAKFDYDNGQTAYLFSTESSDLIATNTAVTTIEIPVGVTTRSNEDRVLPLVVDPSSTATPAMYTIDQSSLVIPAGEFSTTVRVTGNFDNIPSNGGATLVLAFSEFALSGSETHSIDLSRFCSTSLAGLYNVTTTYTAHDFLPSYASNTINGVEVFAGAAVNTYRVLDFSGGLYATGPYATNYGTGSAANAANRDLTFTVNCGAITWTGENDPYGALIPQALYSGTPGAGAYPLSNPQASTYNPATGVITIAWYCVRYGESAVSVYTPAN